MPRESGAVTERDKVVFAADPLRYGIGAVLNITATGNPRVKWSAFGMGMPRAWPTSALTRYDEWDAGEHITDGLLSRLVAAA